MPLVTQIRLALEWFLVEFVPTPPPFALESCLNQLHSVYIYGITPLCPRLVYPKAVFSLPIRYLVSASPTVMTAVQAISSVKVRYTRVSGPKSRNGCITWYV
jgi:hypothetical protein